jgi:hypothetical protein
MEVHTEMSHGWLSDPYTKTSISTFQQSMASISFVLARSKEISSARSHVWRLFNLSLYQANGLG